MPQSEAPPVLRALLVPWSLTSMLFVAISSLLLSMFIDFGLFGLFGSYLLLSWLFKYAYTVLEHVANGRWQAPAASVEMLGPFEQRPLISIAWCAVVWVAARSLGGSAGTAVTIVALLVLPATVAVLGLGMGALQSVNPLTLWRVIRGLGIYYPGMLVFLAAIAAVIVLMARRNAWSIVTIALAEVAVLTAFSTLGGALFERRRQIGHEPSVSPERRSEQENREHARQLSAMLDEVYTQARLKKRNQAMGILRQWLTQVDEQHASVDAHTIVARIAAWNDANTLSLASETLAAELKRRGLRDAAADVYRAARSALH